MRQTAQMKNQRKSGRLKGADQVWFAEDDREAWLLTKGITGNLQVQRYLNKKAMRHQELTWRDHIWRGLYEPASSLPALLWASAGAFFILVTMIISAIRSTTRPGEDGQLTLLVVDEFVAVVFAVEIALRCISSPKREWLYTDALLWLDALLLVPAFWRLAAYPSDPSQLPLVCSIEALGPLRLLKVTRYLHAAQLLTEALAKSFDGLKVMIFFYALVCTVFGSLLYAADSAAQDGGRDSDEESLNIFAAWIEIATLTTVGWVSSDFSPSTVTSRLVVAGASLVGVPVIAIALTVVGSAFSEVWDRRNVHLIRLGLSRLMIKNGVSPNDVFSAYSQSDVDKSGAITFAEFKVLMGDKLKLRLNGSDFLDLWRALDADVSGAITFAEFTGIIFPDLAVNYLEDHYVESEKQLPTGSAPLAA